MPLTRRHLRSELVEHIEFEYRSDSKLPIGARTRNLTNVVAVNFGDKKPGIAR